MNIVEKKLYEIEPYENNPRKNDNAVAYVAESIRQYGFKVPIVIDKDGVIVAGHTRYLASIQLGLESVPCIIADDLNEKQIREFRLVDNKTAEYAGWDFDLLEIELEDLDFEGYDFGFDIEQIDIDESDLDSDEEKNSVVVTINCGDQWNYEQIKERLQNLVDEIQGNLSIKMA